MCTVLRCMSITDNPTLATFLSSDFKLCFFVSLELLPFLCPAVSASVCKGSICNFPQSLGLIKFIIIIIIIILWSWTLSLFRPYGIRVSPNLLLWLQSWGTLLGFEIVYLRCLRVGSRECSLWEGFLMFAKKDLQRFRACHAGCPVQRLTRPHYKTVWVRNP